ncbi:MAG: hypothetical protein ACI90V_008775, partial [Bacillariaceae sp.]
MKNWMQDAGFMTMRNVGSNVLVSTEGGLSSTRSMIFREKSCLFVAVI